MTIKNIHDETINLLKKINRTGVDELISYITLKTDFFTAPASTRFHSCYEGGLVTHSFNVYQMLKLKSTQEPFKKYNFSDESIIICSLLHDLCKTNFYEIEMRNKKNEKGVWEQVPFYTIKDQSPYGHGEKSVMMISEFIKLTAEEKYAIRWHMGFSEPKENYNSVGSALEKYPLVLALSQADMEATYLLETSDGDINATK